MANNSNSSSQMTRSNSIQVEEDKQEAGGDKEVVEIFKDNKMMEEPTITVVGLDIYRLIVLDAKMT